MSNHENTVKVTFRIEFTVESRKGVPTRKAIEGTSLAKLQARVAKMNAYNVHVMQSTI